jgi:cytoskeletal protein RodZ
LSTVTRENIGGGFLKKVKALILSGVLIINLVFTGCGGTGVESTSNLSSEYSTNNEQTVSTDQDKSNLSSEYSNNNEQTASTDEEHPKDGSQSTISLSDSIVVDESNDEPEIEGQSEFSLAQLEVDSEVTQEAEQDIVVEPVVDEQSGFSETTTVIVYTTDTGSKYHVVGCRYLDKSQVQISLEDAKKAGLTPCSVCKPTK